MRFNNKADAMTATIMWIGVVIAVLLSVTWFIMKLRPHQSVEDAIRFDLSEIKSIVSRACVSKYFVKDYNPRIENGFLIANQTHACINSSLFFDCTSLSCNNSNNAIVDLASITYIKISNDKNLIIKGS